MFLWCCSGYLAPEYALRGHLTEKADVFGFGIVALEVVSGRPNFYTMGNERIYLIEQVQQQKKEKKEKGGWPQ